MDQAALNKFNKEAAAILAKAEGDLRVLLKRVTSEFTETPPSPAWWTPTKGPHYYTNDGKVSTYSGADDTFQQGNRFPRPESAKAAGQLVLWYKLLVNLACELNPSGVPCGPYQLIMDANGLWGLRVNDYQSPDSLFETEVAARKAIEIVNARKGQLGMAPSPFPLKKPQDK